MTLAASTTNGLTLTRSLVSWRALRAPIRIENAELILCIGVMQPSGRTLMKVLKPLTFARTSPSRNGRCRPSIDEGAKPAEEQSLAAPQALDKGFATEWGGLVNSKVYQLRLREGHEPLIGDGGPGELGKSLVESHQLEAVCARKLDRILTQNRLPLVMHPF